MFGFFTAFFCAASADLPATEMAAAVAPAALPRRKSRRDTSPESNFIPVFPSNETRYAIIAPISEVESTAGGDTPLASVPSPLGLF